MNNWFQARETLKIHGFQAKAEDHLPCMLDALAFDMYQRMHCSLQKF